MDKGELDNTRNDGIFRGRTVVLVNFYIGLRSFFFQRHNLLYDGLTSSGINVTDIVKFDTNEPLVLLDEKITQLFAVCLIMQYSCKFIEKFVHPQSERKGSYIHFKHQQ